jgi:mRNA interferase MazF
MYPSGPVQHCMPENKRLMLLQGEQLCMGQYICGDVLLASVALDNRTSPKTRPVIVIRSEADGTMHICPVTSKPPTDAPSLPVTIDDFTTGGLDLFSESYVMTSRITTIRNNEVIGKKGRLTPDFLQDIVSRVPATHLRGTGQDPKKKQGRQQR